MKSAHDGADTSLGVAGDGAMHHTGTCNVTEFPWDFDKPGGTGP